MGQALSTLGRMITNNQVMKTKKRTRRKTSKSMKMTVILASMRTAIRMMKRIEMS